MAVARSQTDVTAPPAAVFALITDLARLAEWDPSVRAVEPDTGDPTGPVTRAGVTVGFYGRPIEVTYEIVEADEPHRVVFGIDGRRVRGRREIVLEPLDGAAGSATRVSDTLTVTLRGPARLLDRGLQLALGGLAENAGRALASRVTRVR